MADPLSVAASLLAVATAGVQSTRSLKAAANRYKTRDVTLRRLLQEIEDAENILCALEHLVEASTSRPPTDADKSMAALLTGPIERYSKVCHEFEVAMEKFARKSKPGLIDWAKMEFMKGDINVFMDTVSAYKATISVGLGVLTMHSVKLSRKALDEYDEMVKDTMYNLQLRLRRIDDQMKTMGPAGGPSTSYMDIDLSNERQVTNQCLKICQDAQFYLETLTRRGSTLLDETPPTNTADALHEKFEAQLLTRQALIDNQASFVKIITRLRERLEAVTLNGDSSERVRLQEDIQASRQCLEVCNLASSEVNNQKIHIIGEVIADGESDSIVVTTLAEMFNVGKATSTNNSAILVGSMSDEALIKLSQDRYNSRFGTANTDSRVTHGRSAVSNSEVSHLSSSPMHQRDNTQQPPKQRNPPSSNETRKRGADKEARQKQPREE